MNQWLVPGRSAILSLRWQDIYASLEKRGSNLAQFNDRRVPFSCQICANLPSELIKPLMIHIINLAFEFNHMSADHILQTHQLKELQKYHSGVNHYRHEEVDSHFHRKMLSVGS